MRIKRGKRGGVPTDCASKEASFKNGGVGHFVFRKSLAIFFFEKGGKGVLRRSGWMDV